MIDGSILLWAGEMSWPAYSLKSLTSSLICRCNSSTPNVDKRSGIAGTKTRSLATIAVFVTTLKFGGQSIITKSYFSCTSADSRPSSNLECNLRKLFLLWRGLAPASLVCQLQVYVNQIQMRANDVHTPSSHLGNCLQVDDQGRQLEILIFVNVCVVPVADSPVFSVIPFPIFHREKRKGEAGLRVKVNQQDIIPPPSEAQQRDSRLSLSCLRRLCS